MPRITKTVPVNPLTQHVYIFDVSDLRVYLDQFEVQTRPSTRHKFRVAGLWDRVMPRSSSIKEKPVVPLAVQEEVLNEVRAFIAFGDYEP